MSTLIGLVLPLLVALATPARASYESDFVSRTNAARASHGLRAYPVRYELAAVARRQAARMAAARRIYHNPSLGSQVGNWRSLAENVGRGSDVASIQSAFMSSSSHRANILSTLYTEVGIGTARGGDGLIYVSEVFRRPTTSVYYGPPRTTTTRPTTSRATRSAPRRPSAARPPARKAVVSRVPAHLRAAWVLYRRERPVESLDRALAYTRALRVLAD